MIVVEEKKIIKTNYVNNTTNLTFTESSRFVTGDNKNKEKNLLWKSLKKTAGMQSIILLKSKLLHMKSVKMTFMKISTWNGKKVPDELNFLHIILHSIIVNIILWLIILITKILIINHKNLTDRHELRMGGIRPYRLHLILLLPSYSYKHVMLRCTNA